MGILSFQILYGRPNPDDTREVRNQNPYWKYPRGHTYGQIFVSTKICTAKSIISSIKIVRFSVYSLGFGLKSVTTSQKVECEEKVLAHMKSQIKK